MGLLSIIVPCCNEEAAVGAFYARTSAVCAKLPAVDVEYIFVDDGSADGTLAVGSNVDAISGATVSTRGVVNGVNAALAVAAAMG